LICMKVAIIGTGSIAPVHIRAIKDANEEIVALCDVVPAKAEKLNSVYGLDASIYADYLEMLEKEKLDAVHVCTPHHLHREMIVRALESNINVLAEKPICINESELENIKSATKKSNAQLGVCFQNRYLPANRKLRELLAKEKPLSATTKVVWRRDEAYYKSAPWRGKWETEGGGVMINQAIHTLDLLLWYCGMPEKIKGAIVNTNLKEIIEVETTAEFVMAGKYVASFYATTASYKNFPIEIEIRTRTNIYRIIGEDLYVNGNLQELPAAGELYGKPHWGAGHSHLIRDFYSCLREGRTFPIDVYEAEKSLRVIWALYRSNGQEILI